jgi:hypothetical protein
MAVLFPYYYYSPNIHCQHNESRGFAVNSVDYSKYNDSTYLPRIGVALSSHLSRNLTCFAVGLLRTLRLCSLHPKRPVALFANKAGQLQDLLCFAAS